MRQYIQVFEEGLKFQIALNSAQMLLPGDIQ